MSHFIQSRNGGNLSQSGENEFANQSAQDDQGDQVEAVNAKLMEYIRALLAEKVELDHAKFPIAAKLLDQEITRAREEGRGPGKSQKYVDIFYEKPTKISTKVIVPVKAYPKFNFVGKILGPKGNSLKRLQEETMCRMAVLGRGSMRDREKEEELRNSLDLKYSHLTDDLHVDVSALAPPAEAYARIAFALTELQKYLTPDGSDEISTGQLKEMGLYEERPRKVPRMFHGARAPPPYGRPGGPPAAASARPSGPHAHARPSGPPAHARPAGPAGAHNRPQGGPGQFRGAGPRGAPTGGAKVMSILNRAREAAVGQKFEEDEYEHEQPAYTPSGPSHGAGGSRFSEVTDYEEFYNNSPQDYEGQEWKPFVKSEQPRYRSTPYARNARNQ